MKNEWDTHESTLALSFHPHHGWWAPGEYTVSTAGLVAVCAEEEGSLGGDSPGWAGSAVSWALVGEWAFWAEEVDRWFCE